MPKLKTKRSAAKRLKATGTGKLTRAKGWKKHLLEWKSPKRRRQLRQGTIIDAADQKVMRKLVPYL